MLRANLVERPAVRPLQHGPEGLNPVGMCLPADVFGDGVPDRLVVPLDASVRLRIVGVDLGVFLGVFLDEILQRLSIGSRDDLGADLVRVPILHADYCRLADRAPARTRQRLPLRLRHVLALAAEIGLVNLSYVRKLVTELSGGVFGYLDSVLERHSFDEFGELI